MKTMKLMMALTVVAMAAASCGQKKEDPKMLVVYYSQTSNTKAVAQEIATRLNADMAEITAVNPYDGDFQATIDRCIKDREQGIDPEIAPLSVNVANYDVIFIGYPVWFGTFAPPMATFLKQTDLSGKKIVPFCTFGSGGLETSTKDLAELQPNAEILAGYGVRAARMEAMPEEVDQFLKASGFVDGEFFTPEDFPKQHAVSEEEAAIFDAAVDGYPMIHAKSNTVASRALPNGTEYLFTAANIPDERTQEGEIKVYVSVFEGKAPVFTKVIR